MKLQLIAAAIASTVLSFGAFAQSATESGASSTQSSSCDSLTGEEKTKCLQDEASSQSSAPVSTDSSAGASGGTSSGSDATTPTDTPATKSE